jgi:hypothetical protein
MKHERNFGVERSSLEPYPAWLKMLIWFSVIIFGALSWWFVLNLIFTA